MALPMTDPHNKVATLEEVLASRDATIADLERRLAEAEEWSKRTVQDFAEAILHGDEKHRAWLIDAAEAWVAGRGMPKWRAEHPDDPPRYVAPLPPVAEASREKITLPKPTPEQEAYFTELKAKHVNYDPNARIGGASQPTPDHTGATRRVEALEADNKWLGGKVQEIGVALGKEKTRAEALEAEVERLRDFMSETCLRNGCQATPSSSGKATSPADHTERARGHGLTPRLRALSISTQHASLFTSAGGREQVTASIEKHIAIAERAGAEKMREQAAKLIEARAIAIRDNGPKSSEGLLTALAGAQVGALLDAAAAVRAQVIVPIPP